MSSVGSCHHGMARPLGCGWGSGPLDIAANILNKQSWTANQEWSSSLGVWREANNLTLQKQGCSIIIIIIIIIINYY